MNVTPPAKQSDPIVAVSTPTANVIAPAGYVTGSIGEEIWTGISGIAVSAIPSGTTANQTATLTSFEIPTYTGDNYGVRICGYFIPQTTGTYYFWISSDDNGELWLSTDAQPTNKARIAYVSSWTSSREWNKEPNQKSAGTKLTAGVAYYIEALMKESTDNDNLAVAYKVNDSTNPTNGAATNIIQGSLLAPLYPATPSNLNAAMHPADGPAPQPPQAPAAHPVKPAVIVPGAIASGGDVLTGLQNRWTFEKNLKDTVGGADGKAVDGTPTYKPGKIGNAWFTTGSKTYITSPAATPSNAFTFSFWIKPTTTTNWNNNVGAVNGAGSFRFHTDSTGAVYVGTGDSSRIAPDSLPAGTITLGVWQMVTFTFIDGNAVFYVNGAKKASKTNMDPPLEWGGVQLGFSGPGNIDGGLDDVRLYSRALSEAEVAAVYNAGSPPKQP